MWRSVIAMEWTTKWGLVELPAFIIGFRAGKRASTSRQMNLSLPTYRYSVFSSRSQFVALTVNVSGLPPMRLDLGTLARLPLEAVLDP